MMKNWKNALLTFVMASSLLLGIYSWYVNKVARLMTSRNSLKDFGTETFSPEKWAQKKETRSHLLFDLTGRVDFSKMSLAQIKELLGEGDDYLVSEDVLAYAVGNAPSLRYLFIVSRKGGIGHYTWEISPAPCKEKGIWACVIQGE